MIPWIRKKIDMTDEWTKLKQPGIYNNDLADIALIAIARGIKKDQLIFNTDHIISHTHICIKNRGIPGRGKGQSLPCYTPRIQEPDDEKLGSEIIHILLDTQPSTNINDVYQQTGITNNEADEAHKVLKNKVSKEWR